jgi:hypothetical protein
MNKSLSLNLAIIAGIGFSMLLIASLNPAPTLFLQSAVGQSTTSATNGTTSASNTTGTLSLTIVPAINPISRGNVQTLKFSTTDTQSHQAIVGAQIAGSVTYGSGMVRPLTGGTTDQSGTYTESWTIGGHSNPGTFGVTAQASAAGYSPVSNTTSFQVTTKGG